MGDIGVWEGPDTVACKIGFALFRVKKNCEHRPPHPFLALLCHPRVPRSNSQYLGNLHYSTTELRLTSRPLASVDETWTDSALPPASSLQPNRTRGILLRRLFWSRWKIAHSCIKAYLTPLHRNSILTWPFIYALLCKSFTVKIRYISTLFRFYVAANGLQRMTWQCGCSCAPYPAKIQPHEADSATPPTPFSFFSLTFCNHLLSFARIRLLVMLLILFLGKCADQISIGNPSSDRTNSTTPT